MCGACGGEKCRGRQILVPQVTTSALRKPILNLDRESRNGRTARPVEYTREAFLAEENLGDFWLDRRHMMVKLNVS